MLFKGVRGLLFRLFKFLILVSLFFIILLSLYWSTLSEQTRTQLAKEIKQWQGSGKSLAVLHYKLIELINRSDLVLEKSLSKIENLPIKGQLMEPLEEPTIEDEILQLIDKNSRLASEYWEGSSLPKTCNRVKSREIQAAKTQSVYQWRDKNGRVHFSDKNPDDLSNALSMSDVKVSEYQSEQRFFNLNIIEKQADMTLISRNRIRSDINAIYALLSKGLGFDNLREVDLSIRLFINQDDFQHYKSKVAPRSKTNTGFYLPSLNEASIVQWTKRPELTYGVIRHESSHVIMAGLFGSTPRWFNEGLAEYVELLSVSGQHRRVAVDKDKLIYLHQQLDRNQLLDLATLWSFDARQFYQNARLHYAMAWSVIHFMLSKDEPRQVFLALIKHFYNKPCQPVDMPALVNAHYSGGMAVFESDYLLSLRLNTLKDQYY